MAGIPAKAAEDLDYPTSDGKPMAETDWHRDLMMALIQTLGTYYADDPMVYVSGNLLVFYEPGNRRRHVSPDVFVVNGVEKRQRPELPDLGRMQGAGGGHRADFLVHAGRGRRRQVRTVSRHSVRSRVLPLRPARRLHAAAAPGLSAVPGAIRPVTAVEGRLPSKVLGLHLEGQGRELRLYDPASKRRLPTVEERAAQAEAEVERLRRELEALRRRLSQGEMI